MFVREYLIDMNATQAGIRAGYAPKKISGNIHRVLWRPRVRAALEAAMAARERDLQIDATEVLREIARLGFANLLDYVTVNADGTADVDLTGLTRDRAAAIAEITVFEESGPHGIGGRGKAGRGAKGVRLKLADKPRSLNMLGKHLGLFPRGAARRDEAAAGDGGGVPLSDIERAQLVLGILARAGRGGADEDDC
jgi:phage terminase small subunit